MSTTTTIPFLVSRRISYNPAFVNWKLGIASVPLMLNCLLLPGQHSCASSKHLLSEISFSVLKDDTSGFTHNYQNILCPRSNRTTKDSPSIWMNLYGPFHRLILVRWTSTGKPAGNFGNSNECYFPFCPLVCLSRNAGFLCTYFFAFYSMEQSMSLAISNVTVPGVSKLALEQPQRQEVLDTYVLVPRCRLLQVLLGEGNHGHLLYNRYPHGLAHMLVTVEHGTFLQFL